MLLDMQQLWPALGWLFLGVILYAEVHYRWWPFPSRYFRKEPEILADTPRRLDPGQRLPVLLLVKDAHRYPISLETVIIERTTPEGRQHLHEEKVNQDISQLWWHHIIKLERPEFDGEMSLWVTFHYKVRGRTRTCTTHNFRSLKSKPLRIFLATHRLPGQDVLWGDLHVHSASTEDMIEFAAPLDATQQAATAVGLDFLCITDHSYDLDDLPGDWRKTDTALTKWHASRAEMTSLNQNNTGALLIPGEEVSVRNTLGRNIHALVLANPDFLPGSGDGGERPLKTRSELDVDGLAERLLPESVAVAAHPYQPIPILQWVFIKRGLWEDRDLQPPSISGLQILNGRMDAGFFRGVEEWKRSLLKGHRKYIYAGNDAHGSFNAYRQIKIPFLALDERQNQVLGICRTGVLDAPSEDMTEILAGLKSGRCIITTGPFINMYVAGGQQSAGIGGTVKTQKVQVTLDMRSSEEFGPLAGFRLLRGTIGQEREELLEEAPFESNEFRIRWESSYELEPGTSYFRAELESWLPERARLDDIPTGIALTNPIWVECL
jgi:hypothetical protein